MLRQIRTCAVERSMTLPFAVIGYRLGRHCEAQGRSRKAAVGRLQTLLVLETVCRGPSGTFVLKPDPNG